METFFDHPKVIRTSELHLWDLMQIHLSEVNKRDLQYLIRFDGSVGIVPVENDLLVAMTLNRLLEVGEAHVRSFPIYSAMSDHLYKSQRATLLQAYCDGVPISARVFHNMCEASEGTVTGIAKSCPQNGKTLTDRLAFWHAELRKKVEELCAK